MAGITSIEVKESLDELAQQLCQVNSRSAKERLQVRALAEAGECTEYQRNCQSSGKTASRRANLVIEVPRGWSSSDVRNQEITWGSAGDSAMGRDVSGGIFPPKARFRRCFSKAVTTPAARISFVMEKYSNG